MDLLLCPHCGKKSVSKVKGVEPWSCDHLICSACDSTYVDEDAIKQESNIGHGPTATYVDENQ